MKVAIVIDGESAKDLFAVGSKDLVQYFLPKKWGVKKKDVVKITMEQFFVDDKEVTLSEVYSSGKPFRTRSDNYRRKDKGEATTVLEASQRSGKEARQEEILNEFAAAEQEQFKGKENMVKPDE